MLAVVVVAALAISLAARWAARHQDAVRGWSARQLKRPTVVGLRGRFRRQLDFLGRRFRPEGALGLSLTASLALLVAVGWLFGTVVQDVLAGDDAARLDRPTLEFFARHREPWLTTTMKVLTSLGSSAQRSWSRRSSWLAWCGGVHGAAPGGLSGCWPSATAAR